MIRVFLCGPLAESGGVWNHTINIAHNLLKMDVEIIWHKDYGSSLSKFYKKTIGLLIESILQRYNYEIIHVQASAGIGSLPTAQMGAVASYLMNKRFIFTYHNSKILYPRLFKLCLQKADKVILVSQYQKSQIKKYYPEQIHKTVVIPNGFDYSLFFPRDQNECRVKLGLPTNKTILLTVGSLLEVKGHSHLIEAMRLVVNKRKDVICVIVGSGPLTQKLEDLIKLSGLENDIILAGGRSHDEIPLWMNACDLFVLPSLNEGNPTVLVEALGCGKPFVGTRVGGVPEVIASDVYGLLVEPADSGDLAEKILVALDREWDREAILAYSEQYTWENIAKEIMGVYKQVLG